MKREYVFNWILRVLFLILGMLGIIAGIAADGVKFLGTTTKQGAFTPIIVGCYETCMLRSARYRWKIKYEFYVDGEKYVGSKYLRGGDSSINYKKEIGYLKVYPRINWLETGEPKGINCLIGLLLGQAFIWLAFKKRAFFTHDLNRTYNGIFYPNTGILPVRGMNTSELIEFLKNLFRVGIGKLFTVRVLIFANSVFLIWFIILYLRANYPQNAIVTAASWFTYARGGIHGSITDVFGGILGKIIYISFFLQLILEGVYNTNYYKAYPAKNNTIYGYLSSFGSLLIGIGVSFCLYAFMTANFNYEDSFIGLILFFSAYKAQKNINNPITLIINSFVSGRPRNANAARVALLGASLGFMASFILIWTKYVEYLGYYTGLMFTVAGACILFLSSLLKKSQSEIEVEL